MEKFYIPDSAMAIVAHPDDIEFSCAGTLARWAKAGSRIAYVLCTSGEVGIAEVGMSKSKAAEIRETEQRNAADIVGAQEVVFLREPDGMLQATLELRKKLIREIRRFRPEVVVCGDPTIVWAGDSYINHPDHRAAATAALDAVFPAAGQPNLFEELNEEDISAHKPRKVYVTSWTQTDQYINITGTLDIKVAALRAHESQMKDWDPEPRIKEWAAERAKGKEMTYAEAFRVVTLVSDEDWEKTNGRVLPE
ncbi:MAG: PIG-L family deacetylase [Anaerolineales bacterium]|jgi:LmbE family N-acetylglucosaminyl deacetylase|nr:PIG-L family deacetylase [Anaerolineales bacterium]